MSNSITPIGTRYHAARERYDTTMPMRGGKNAGTIPLRADRSAPDRYSLYRDARWRPDVKEIVGCVAARMYSTDVVIWWEDGWTWVSDYGSNTTRDVVNMVLGINARGSTNGVQTLFGHPEPDAGAYWQISPDGHTQTDRLKQWVRQSRNYPTMQIGRVMRQLKRELQAMAVMKAAAGSTCWDLADVDTYPRGTGDRDHFGRAAEAAVMAAKGKLDTSVLPLYLERYAGVNDYVRFARLDAAMRTVVSDSPTRNAVSPGALDALMALREQPGGVA